MTFHLALPKVDTVSLALEESPHAVPSISDIHCTYRTSMKGRNLSMCLLLLHISTEREYARQWSDIVRKQIKTHLHRKPKRRMKWNLYIVHISYFCLKAGVLWCTINGHKSCCIGSQTIRALCWKMLKVCFHNCHICYEFIRIWSLIRRYFDPRQYGQMPVVVAVRIWLVVGGALVETLYSRYSK